MKVQNENNDLLLIEDFLDGKINEKEKKMFFLRLKNDSDFSELYNFRLKIRKDWERAYQYDDTYQQVKKAIFFIKKRNRNKRYYTVAASFVFLILFSGIYSFFQITQKNQQLISVKPDSTENKIYNAQIKEQKIYADSGQYIDGIINKEQPILNFKIRHDSLIFNWNTVLESETEIIIVRQENKLEVFRKKTRPFSSFMILNRSELPSGKFIWCLDGFSECDSIYIN